MAADPPTSEPTSSQVAQLTAVLATVDRARASLPSLLRSFGVPASSPAERASVYRERSNEAWNSIKALRASLEAVQPLLDKTAASENADAVGIVVREREVRGVGLERLKDVMHNSDKGRKGKQKKEFVAKFNAPATPVEVDELVQRWQTDHPNVRIELRGVKEGGEAREIRITVKGLMWASCMLHWTDARTGGRVVMVERVACFGLKEDKSTYLQSQYGLFQTITNDAMHVVYKSLRRSERSETVVSNVEEVLAFLTDPPTPF
ncbi:hypothetical protein MNV49_005356 [Pseudohyphozyma bogoriensis]|nr:hypothetical protein MNV49_005356 [Pseudohyphozyma bogoriensis]